MKSKRLVQGTNLQEIAQSKRSHLRTAVFARDLGVCASCGLDTENLKRLVFPVRPDFHNNNWRGGVTPYPQYYEREFAEVSQRKLAMAQYLDKLSLASRERGKYPWLRGREPHQPLWEADHEIPLAEGGPDSLDNLRTLCRGCHKTFTADLKRRLAKRPIKKSSGRRL